MIVDFPDPDDPTIAVNFPSGIENETFLRTVTLISFSHFRVGYLVDEQDI